MNDIHTRSAELAVRPRVSNVALAKNGAVDTAAEASEKTVRVSGSDVPDVPDPVAAVGSERVHQAVARLNDYVQSLHRDIRFSVDDDSGRAVVRVVDRDTQEVIRQIPSELALRLARNLNQHGRDGEGLLRVKA